MTLEELLRQGKSFGQGASNAAASTVTGPVDMLAWLLRKGGVNVGDAPMGGEAWMRQKGLMATPENKLAGLLGEGAGLAAPIVAAAKAPEIAGGLLQMGRNLAAPQTMNKQTGAVLADYKGQHSAPMKGEGSAPLNDLAQIYPDDIYSSKAAQYYGHWGDSRDIESVRLMQAAKGRPNMEVTMYRAVPDLTADASKEMKAIRKTIEYKDKFGFFPMKDDLSSSFRAKYETAGLPYDEIQAKAYQDMLDKVNSLRQTLKKPLPINNGDWVTLSKAYAKEHGESALNGNYKIVSKKVPARKLFTDGNSIHEFGYDESGKISNAMLGLLGGTAGAGAYLLDKNGGKP